MNKLQLITLDVWDTLLRRRCYPDAVKLYLSNYLLNKYSTRIKPQYCDAWALMRVRQQVEGKIGIETKSKGFDDEYRLTDVYRQWISDVFLSDDYIEEILYDIESVEMEQEKYVLYADPDIKTLLDTHASLPKIFISDFYMSADKINELLNHAGLNNYVSKGYSSSDHNLNKRSGRLFEYVLNEEKIHKSTVLHIGDNLHSDVKMPKDLGMEAQAYQPQKEFEQQKFQKKCFENREMSVIELLRDFKAIKSSDEFSDSQRNLYEYGNRCAPLFIGFVFFVMERAIRNGHSKIYFFTREGEFFKEIYDKLAASMPSWQEIPSSELLEVSRIATFGPSLRSFDAEELMRIWNMYSTQSVAALLKSINVELDTVVNDVVRHGIDPYDSIQYPWQDTRVIGLLSDSDFLETINKDLVENKNSLISYLDSKGLSLSSKKAAIVDIGWRGTIQDNLAYLLPGCMIDGFYLGLEKFLNNQPANCAKISYGPNMNLSDSERYAGFYSVVSPLEMLCNSPNGSVVGYKTNSGEVSADRVVDSDENLIYENYIQYFQKGVIDSVTPIAEILRVHAINSDEISPFAYSLWERIIRQPSSEISLAYFQLNHNEQFGLGKYDDKRRRISIVVWLKALLSPKGMKALIRNLESTGWPEGYLSRDNLLFVWDAIKLLRKVKYRLLG